MTSTVTVFVTSPDTRSERRFDLYNTVNQLKTRLESVTGIPPASQRITLHRQGAEYNDFASVLAVLDDDEKPLGYYSIQNWQVLKEELLNAKVTNTKAQVEDTDPTAPPAGEYTDVSKVEKFEISNEEYGVRRDTILAYKQAHKVGRFAPPSLQNDAEGQSPDIPLNSRCEVNTGDEGFKKRGIVRFVGPTKFAKGIWVGIEYDEPMGKNDGSVQGERYFTTRPLYGGFVRPDRVRVGDFPVEELGLSEEEI